MQGGGRRDGGAREQIENFQEYHRFADRTKVRARPRCESHKPTTRISGTPRVVNDELHVFLC